MNYYDMINKNIIKEFNGISFTLDTSAYVEYSSSSDDEEKVNRTKVVKRRKDDSDSGSDVSE